MKRRACFAVILGIAGCGRNAAAPGPAADAGRSTVATPQEDASVSAVEMTDAGAIAADIPEPPQLDPDGNDDPEDPGTGSVPTEASWERVGTAPLALTRICDLTPFHGALYAAHAHQPLGTDGATITKYARGTFRVAFDWNRPGEPVKGGGAGQGFVRVHAIDGRLFVPDADPPYGGLKVVDWGTEGYVFSSDEKGIFPAPRAPHFQPPANVGVLPHAYHVLDVIEFRGAYFASTGSVPPKEPAWRGHSPGALHRANADRSRWIYETDYPHPLRDDGVWRLTYLVRFKDRLYAGIQDYDGRDPNDFVYFTPNGTDPITHEDAHPTRITTQGASGTLRWWVDTHARPHRLYWLAWTKKQGIGIWATTDGDTWTRIEIPPENGLPTDITRFRDRVVILTDNGLYRLEDDDSQSLIATVERTKEKKPKSPFEITDFFCTAPLAVMDNVLYAGGQRGGSLYRLVESADAK